MRILITGASGFLGRALVRELAGAGHELTLLAHTRQVPRSFYHHEVVTADLRDTALLRKILAGAGCERVCHLAALTGIRDSSERVDEYFSVNVGGTVSLLTAMQGHSAGLVFASSRAVYAESLRGAISEDSPTAPSSPYGVSKLLCERVIALQSATAGLSAWSLRCFNVSGGIPGVVDGDLRRLIPRLLAATKGEVPPPEINSLHSVRDYVHVADVVRAYRLALEADLHPAEHRVVNVGSGRGHTTGEVIACLEKLVARPVPTVPPPPAAGDQSDVSIANIEAARRLLGWTPRRSLADIISDAALDQEETA
ncbi:NAD-dependent epimerase/dehydratase family protein [Paractinoplanes brasiliensis]|uniref:UDP-glucose 4-epimerase n=1 Tax=Paractinoplanes brasiliensis TaxID=52695 RepID=A0A4R6JBI1_9ACTN|nr:NAD-dependent epimerase/dehydratase family protein [Actinoplanes brasiliensis]TDO32281.1 UDP-glucose 4-epimerase [Actinoplanes brasiliensis]GID27851.1 UDP-glucose 4-epimerase GalE [Actinoplanes brasiliensis]